MKVENYTMKNSETRLEVEPISPDCRSIDSIIQSLYYDIYNHDVDYSIDLADPSM